MHFLKSFNREKSTQEEKVRFMKGNELKLNQVELLSFFNFKSMCSCTFVYIVFKELIIENS